MDRRSKIIIGIFIGVLLAIIATEVSRPRPIDWKPSYSATDKIPFGGYVLFKELPQLFPNESVALVDESIYPILRKRDISTRSNYIAINDVVVFDKQEAKQLLQYVHDGNDVFIAATSFDSYLSDTLKIKVKTSYSVLEDTVILSHTNTAFPTKKHLYSKGLNHTYFTTVDSLKTSILGHIEPMKKPASLLDDVSNGLKTKRPNFIRVQYGQGYFYLCTTPQAFTNYYMLRGNKDYVSYSLSYLKNNPIYWDNYKKAGRKTIDSPLRFVLSKPELKWGYYTSIMGILLFVLFKAKREQRIIPVIKPLANSSIEFAKTIGSLYFEHKDYSDLIAKKINYFLAYLRTHYYINTDDLSDKTVKELSAKSGISLVETKEIVEFLRHIKLKTRHSEEDLIALHKKISTFKK
ncbi:hypothetical protein SAMN04487911_10298 [Arenibacter nanhaiticus]|uniref:DUF4350 domain-containing protein n=1 Tax=Arenibacter nanhaiticus TaxID=558155 RepID=A0A1M6B8F5_9FLAO|nr:DUF4350 domain-containing protein [Arenibacter nanhaiticus]SHI44858.1 hypothetical protein SAMN04487911_10298 [Arenibacter nanhaiticus]